MKRTLLLIPASVVIVAGVVAGLWAFGSASGERARFSSLEAAPAHADVFYAVNTDPTSPQWLAVNDSLASLNAKDPIRKAIDEALANVNLEWDRDIAPVAGDEAFFSVRDIRDAGENGGWTAGVLLNDPQRAREVFDMLRQRNDSPPMTQEDYNGIAIWTTDVGGETSGLSGPAPAFMQVTPTPSPFPYDPDTGECIEIRVGPDGQPTTVPCENDPPGNADDEGWLEYSLFDCGGFGYNADGTPNEDAFGGEPCESDSQYCLWWGFVPRSGEAEPYTTEPCRGTSSYCGSYAMVPLATPAANGLPCGADFDYWFQAPTFDDGFLGDGEYNIFEDDTEFGFEPTTPSTTAIAFVDSVLALGGSVDDVKAIIDVVQGRADNATTNPRLQEFRALQKDDFLVWGYVDLADVWAEAEDIFATPSYSGVDAEAMFEQIRTTYDRVGFSISSFSDGFGLDLTVVHSEDFDESNRFEPTRAYDPAIAELLPEDTMFYVSWFDLFGQSWLPAKEQWEGLDLGDDESLQVMMDAVKDETGIDLETDVLALLTGELALAGDVSGGGDGGFSIFGIADVSDEGKARDTLDRFEAYLEGEGGLEASDDGDLRVWADPAEGDGIAWYIADGRIVAGFPVEAVEGLPSGGRLAGNADWQRTLELLPGDKTFVGFLSIARILEEFGGGEADEQLASVTGGEITLDDLKVIRSLGMAGTASENGFGLHFVLFMKDK